jgi:murein DD-endopeptidase MepM/ murein hydrolase activator NlpD
MQHLIKRFLDQNFKSSQKFGRLAESSHTVKELFRERRFLYFTKKGPIEIVFNLKHYISAFVLSIVFVIKILQLMFFGVSSFFSYVSYKNDKIVKKNFTDSEIQTLKSIANSAINKENIDSTNEVIVEFPSQVFENSKETSSTTIKLKEKLNNIKNLVSNFGRSFQYEINHSDEVVFDQFSRLASPEMIAMEHTVGESKTEVKPYKKKSSFSYNYLPVVPYVAPRTKKLKIINFTKKLDQEILQLVNVFKSLRLQPDEINLAEIESFLKPGVESFSIDNDQLIDHTSLRFQFIEELKNAIIFLPLKPPMQYYYVSSPYGYRIHPKTKLKQMHYGIDMAGTWQEEVRAPADGFIVSAGRNGSFGKSIKIMHKHGVSTIYGHLHKLTVKKGSFVSQGDIIGKMGSTGRAVGAHLHYEIKVNNKPVNPYNFISIGRELISSSILRR